MISKIRALFNRGLKAEIARLKEAERSLLLQREGMRREIYDLLDVKADREAQIKKLRSRLAMYESPVGTMAVLHPSTQDFSAAKMLENIREAERKLGITRRPAPAFDSNVKPITVSTSNYLYAQDSALSAVIAARSKVGPVTVSISNHLDSPDSALSAVIAAQINEGFKRNLPGDNE